VNRLNARLGPNLNGKAYTIDADVVLSAAGATGVIFSRGGRYGGSTLFVKNGRLIYEVNANGTPAGKIVDAESLPVGEVHIRVEVAPAGQPQPRAGGAAAGTNNTARVALPGIGKLFVNEKLVGEGNFLNLNGTGAGVDIGSNVGSPVSSEYKEPNYFTGGIQQVTIQVK
jgi:hypothetical protein